MVTRDEIIRSLSEVSIGSRLYNVARLALDIASGDKTLHLSESESYQSSQELCGILRDRAALNQKGDRCVGMQETVDLLSKTSTEVRSLRLQTEKGLIVIWVNHEHTILGINVFEGWTKRLAT